MLESSHQSFPITSVVWRTRLIEFPLDTFFTRVSVKTCWFQLRMLFNNSLWLAVKFVPFSDQITSGTPRLDTNISIPITQLLMSIEGTTSKWTARVVKQLQLNVPLTHRTGQSSRVQVTGSQALFREINHHRMECYSFALAASEALRVDWPQCRPKFHNGKSFLT